MATGVEIEGAGFAHQFHAGLDRGLVAFPPVAGMAAGHKILPG